MLKQARVYIKGDVIGVGFRAWCKIQTKPLGVTGWIRNVFDSSDIFGAGGGVEACFQAEEDVLIEILDKVKQGPPVSHVEDTEVILEEPREVIDDFTILPNK